MTDTREPFAIDRRNVLLGSAAAGMAMAGLPVPAYAARQKFVTANNNPYDILDPHQVFDIGRIAIRLNMYDALMRWVDNPPKLENWLVAKYEIAPDGKKYTFTLKPNVKFHDGSPMTSEDVVYSMERILALKLGAYGLFKDVILPGTTKALDPQTVEFNLKDPFAVFLAVLSELWVVNSKLVKRNEKGSDWGAPWLTRNEAGSGGYALRRFDPAVGFQVQRFEGHFAPFGKNPVDDADFRVSMETATRVLGVMKGEFNTTDGYLPREQMARLKADANIKTWESESIRTFYFIINSWKAPLNDANMRRALSYAFDYDGFNNDILGGTVVRNPGIIPNPMWGAPKDLKGYTYDLDKAKHHLGLVKEKIRPLQIGVMTGYPQSEQAGQMLQAGCAKIGLDVKIVSEPFTTINPKLSDRERAHDLVPLWRSAYFADPHNWTGFLFNSGNFDAGNASYFKNARVDELCTKALQITDQEQRRAMYEEVSRILVDEAAGIFINNTKYHGAFTKNVKNIRFCPIGDAQDLRWIEMEGHSSMRLLVLALKRVAWMPPTLLGLTLIVFVVSHIIPADPARVMAGENASAAQVQAVRVRFGLDKPLPQQFVRYVTDVASGEMGISLYSQRPVADDLLARLPATFELAIAAIIVAILIGLPLGVVSALYRNSLLDQAVRLVTIAGLAMAAFWLAILLQLLFSMKLGITPVQGRVDGWGPDPITGFYTVDALLRGDWQTLGTALRYLALPTFTLAIPAAATIVRFTRAGVLNVLSSNFVFYQGAMGLPRSVVIWKYILRSALIGTLTQIGLVFGNLLAGAVVVETVFSWPGLGQFAYNSILQSDYNAIMGFTLFTGSAFIAVNLLVDIAQAVLDPRER